jgi:uncharacterized protein YlxW (UPF0749 family)
MKQTFFTLFLLALLSFVSAAQDLAKTSDNKSKPENLALSPAEIEGGQKAQRELQDSVNALNQALQQTQSVKTDDQAQALFWKLKSFYADLINAEKGYGVWLTATQKAHDCANCSIQGNRFVRNPPKTEKPAN